MTCISGQQSNSGGGTKTAKNQSFGIFSLTGHIDIWLFVRLNILASCHEHKKNVARDIFWSYFYIKLLFYVSLTYFIAGYFLLKFPKASF